MGFGIPAGSFKEVPPVKRRLPIRVTVRVRSNMSVQIYLSKALQEELGHPKLCKASCTTHEDFGYVRLEFDHKDGKHAVVEQMHHASITLRAHPFEPGVIHASVDVEFERDGNVVTIKMPDWDEILGQALAAQEEEADE